MNIKSDNQIYYFLIINQTINKEIGHILLHQNGTIDDFNAILAFKHQTMFQLASNQHMTIKKELSNHNVYGKSINKNTLYFIAIKKNHHSSYKQLIEALIKEIEHQGIKRLIDSNGELSTIGSKTLMFSIEKFMRHYNKKKNKTKKIIMYFNTLMLLIRVNRLIKQLIKIFDSKKNEQKYIRVYYRRSTRGDSNSHSNNKRMAIRSNDITIAKEKIRKLNRRILRLYYHFILFIVMFGLFFAILFRPIDCIYHCFIDSKYHYC